MNVTWTQDIYFLISLILTGIFAGYLAGLFGVGGGVVIVPVLATIFPYFGYDYAMDMHCAVGTSLALVAPGAIAATLRHAKQGTLEHAVWKFWLLAVIFGVLVGTIITNKVPGSYLKLAFTIYMFVVAVAIYRRKPSVQAARNSYPRRITQFIVGACIGCVSSVLGLGGGSFAVPFYSQYNLPLKRAIALGSVTGIAIGSLGMIGAVINGWGTMGRPPFSVGYVNIPALLIIAPLITLAAPQGAKLSHVLPSGTLRLLCAGFYLFMGSYMLYKFLFI